MLPSLRVMITRAAQINVDFLQCGVCSAEGYLSALRGIDQEFNNVLDFEGRGRTYNNGRDRLSSGRREQKQARGFANLSQPCFDQMGVYGRMDDAD